jgi:isopenicillin-N epimerase
MQKYFMLDRRVTFLNHGSFGATSRPVFNTYQKWQRELEAQPVEFLGRRFRGLMESARDALGNYLGTSGDNLVFTTNVTESLNIVAHSLELGPNDEVLSTNHEYGALDRTWKFLAKERGFTYINFPVYPLSAGQDDDSFEEYLWSGVSQKTRLIFISQITSPTAVQFPLSKVLGKARARGILTVIDGAHVPGHIPLRLDEFGADFYGGNLHKWLCAPKGSGFLYARPEVQQLLKPLIISWGYEPEAPGKYPFIDLHEWKGTQDIAAYLSVPSAIQFHLEYITDSIRSECHQLLMQACNRIQALTNISRLCFFASIEDLSKRQPLQMAVMPLPDALDLAIIKTRLYEEFGVEIPLIDWNGRKLIRVSVQCYNNQKDIDRLLFALARLIG